MQLLFIFLFLKIGFFIWKYLVFVLFLWENVVTDTSPYQLFSDTCTLNRGTQSSEIFYVICCVNNIICSYIVAWYYLLSTELFLSTVGNWKITVTQVSHWVDIFVLSAEPNTVSFLWNAKSVVSSKKR